ncbi:helix-turn-helix domain-containing protein [Kribbella ginsengisoli]
MTIRFDSGQIPAVDRDTAVREIISASIVPVEIDFPAHEGPVVRGAISDVGSLRVCSIKSNATKAERTERLARDAMEPSVFLGLQVSGSSLVVQNEREAVLRPGDLVLYESAAPYTLVDADGIQQVQIRIPTASLGLPGDVLRMISAVKLSPGHPVADLAAAYFRRMAARPDLISQPGAQAISQPSIELVRALITTHLDLAAPQGDAMHASLRLRILEYVRANLRDPDLTAAQIAVEHHISVRHLYNVLAEGGISLGGWIREQRLEGCRDDLARAGLFTTPIGAIAKRWGFTDPSSFGRSFRAAYGLSPREWRIMAHQDPAGLAELRGQNPSRS